MSIFTLITLAISLTAALIQHAGYENWNWTLAPAGLVVGIYFLVTSRETSHRIDRFTAVLCGVFCGVVILQGVPLPVAIVRLLSPHRVDLLKATETVLGPGPSWTTLSVVPQLTRQWALTVVADILVFLTLRELTRKFRDQRRIWLAIWPLLIMGAFEGALGFVQARSADELIHAHGTYGNYDHYAGLLELILPFAALYPYAIVTRQRERHESPAGPALKACGVLVFAALILIGILYSLSRMAFLATLASLFVAGSLALSLRDSRIAPPVRIVPWRRYLPTALVAIVVVLGFIFLPTDPLIARFADLAHTDDISADTRAQIWRDSVGIVKEYPIFGCGIGGYESAFYKFKIVAPMNTNSYAHNDYLQVLCELGIVGFAAGLLLLYRVLRSAVRGIIYAGSPDERCISIACLASLTAILLHSFVDFNMYRQANAMTVAWICGIACYRLTSSRKRTTSSSLSPSSQVPTPSHQ